MKNDKRNIQEKINKTLDVLDKVEKIETDPFFYTRLSARLEKQESKPGFDWLFETPLLKPILVGFVLVVNIISISHFVTAESTVLTDDEIVEMFNEEYFITQSSDSYSVINEDF